MDVPLEIAFHNLEKSVSVETRVRERVAKLEKLYPRLVACRVVVEAPHRQHQKGNIYRVRVEMSVPGDDLVVSKEPNRANERFADPDVYTVLKDAFDTAERMLKDFKAKQSGDTKVHDVPITATSCGSTPATISASCATPRARSSGSTATPC